MRKTWVMFLVSSIPVPALWLTLNWLHEGAAILALRGSVKAALVINAGAFFTYVAFFTAILTVTSLSLRLWLPSVYYNFVRHSTVVAGAGLVASTIPWAVTGVPLSLSSVGWMATQIALWVLAVKTLSSRPPRPQLARDNVRVAQPAHTKTRLPSAS